MLVRHDFECRACEHRINDLMLDHDEPGPTVCEKCGGEVRKVFDGGSDRRGGHFTLTGEGFHNTDYSGPTSR